MKNLKCLILALLMLSGCGEIPLGGENTEPEPPDPMFLLVNEEGSSCPKLIRAETAFDVFSSALSEGTADVVGVANTQVIEECSGAGGTHVFSTPTVNGARFWLGAHACFLDEQDPNFLQGTIVGIGSQTAAWFQGDEGWCMTYPGENEVFATSVSTKAMAFFRSEAEAARFLEAL